MAKGKTTVEKAEELAIPIAKELGLTLWDVRFEKEGASWYLRFIIDKSEGISFDDCEAFSRAIDGPLDDEDFISQSYYLDVASPGIGRELKKESHFIAYIGKEVKVKLIRPSEKGEKLLIGVINKFCDKILYLDCGGEEKEISLSDVSWVKVNDDKFLGGMFDDE